MNIDIVLKNISKQISGGHKRYMAYIHVFFKME